jgi:DMSO reductase family type II enzyme heme b subunit
MQARYIAPIDTDALLDPNGSVWRGAAVAELKLMGTPVGLQPTGAIRNTWIDRKIGAVSAVAVAAVHDGSQLAFRLEWRDPSEDRAVDDPTAFVDAAGVLLPAAVGAPSMTMGAPGLAVNAWYWRSDEDGRGRHVVAEGLGTTRTVDVESVRGRGLWQGGRWRVVIARALRVATAGPVAQLRAGESTGFAVAVWDGAHAERGGIKAFSGDWQALQLAAVPTARR